MLFHYLLVHVYVGFERVAHIAIADEVAHLVQLVGVEDAVGV